ncbi:MAG: response regulator transcription factor [Terracidiphilus sp.]
MRILVIEDEPRMLELLRVGLQERDCAVMTARDGETGLEIATAYEFDAILLDIGLPRRDGYELVQAMRERSCLTRVLMLTARDGEDDIIRGLDLGADDYMTKPFSFPELVARLQSITRPRRDDSDGRIEMGDLVVDLIRRSVTRDCIHVDLTRSEFSLLVSLIRSAGRCVPRQSLMEGVWGSDPCVSHGALDVLVNSLRSKIDAPYRQKLIHTVRGSGYLLDCATQEVESARR